MKTILVILSLASVTSYAQSDLTSSEVAKVKLKLNGYEFQDTPKARWIDNAGGGFIRFKISVRPVDCSSPSSVAIDSSNVSEEQAELCSEALNTASKIKPLGTEEEIENMQVDPLSPDVYGTVTFSTPDNIQQTKTQKNITQSINSYNYRYPITITSIPFSDTGLPRRMIYDYKTSYTAYIDKSGKFMKVDSTGAVESQVEKNRYTWANCWCTSVAIAYRSKNEADSILSNYLTDKKPLDYRINEKSQYVYHKIGTTATHNVYRPVAELQGWTLTTKSGTILPSSQFLTCSNLKAGNQQTRIEYIGSNRYWVENRCIEGITTLLLDYNGKILARFTNDRIKKDRFKAGYLVLDSGNIINLQGKSIYYNKNHSIEEIIDNSVAYGFVRSTMKKVYINFLTGKVIYTEGDYEQSGRTTPSVR